MTMSSTCTSRFRSRTQRRIRVAQFTLVYVVAALLSANNDATATTMESWSEHQIAQHTIGWVRARVRDSEPAEDHQCKVMLEVLDSTDSDLPAIIYLLVRDSCDRWMAGDEEFYIALQGDGDTFSTPHMVRNAAYKVSEDRTAERDLLWDLRCDMRTLVDQGGVVSSALRKKWDDRLRGGNLEETRLALSWLEQLREPNIDPMFLARSVQRHFRALPQRTSGDRTGYYFMELYRAAVLVVAGSERPQAVKILVDIYWKDQTSHHVLDGNSTDHLVVRLILTPPSENNVHYLGSLLGTGIDADAAMISSFAQTPGEPMRELLWGIIEDPQFYGITDHWPLEAVWAGLASREDPNLRLYLKTHVLDPNVPDLGIPPTGKAKSIKDTAREYYDASLLSE